MTLSGDVMKNGTSLGFIQHVVIWLYHGKIVAGGEHFDFSWVSWQAIRISKSEP